MAILLLVDPSQTIRRVVEMAFKASGHDIVAVASAAEGQQSVARYDPAVVLVNYILPDASGLELCHSLRNDPAAANVPIVLLGGTYEPFEESQGLQAGANVVLMKPFKTESLLSTVDGLLADAPTTGPPVAQPDAAPSVPAPPPAPPRMPPAIPQPPQAAPSEPRPVAAPQPVARIRPARQALPQAQRPSPPPPPSSAPPVPPPPPQPVTAQPVAAPPPQPVSTPAIAQPTAPAPPPSVPPSVENADAIRSAVREYLPQLVRDALAQLLRDGLENRLRTYAQDRVDAMFRENLRELARQLVEQELQRLRGG